MAVSSSDICSELMAELSVDPLTGTVVAGTTRPCWSDCLELEELLVETVLGTCGLGFAGVLPLLAFFLGRPATLLFFGVGSGSTRSNQEHMIKGAGNFNAVTYIRQSSIFKSGCG